MSHRSSHLVILYVVRSLSKLIGVVASPMVLAAAEEPEEEIGSTGFWIKLMLSLLLVLLGGIFAGLTIGLMGLDQLHLRVLSMASDDEVERKNAAKVLKLLQKGRHWVLVVLLLGNVIVNESLPIFLDSALYSGNVRTQLEEDYAHLQNLQPYREIIPQAACARYGLSIGARCTPFVLTLMYVFAPIAWPIAKLLDYVLGAHDEHTYKKAELRSFLQFHRQGEEPLRDDEIAILNGVLELNTKSVVEIMTPMQDVLTLSTDDVLDHSMLDKILISGYSRLPVHEPGNDKGFVGLLLIKRLLRYDPEDKWRVSDFSLNILPEAQTSINCFQALDYFQTGRAHLLLVSETPGVPGGAVGVVTLEDIIEEIIGEEIVDEFDRYEDNQTKKAARRRGNAAIMKGIIEHVKRRATMPEVHLASDLGIATPNAASSTSVLNTPSLLPHDLPHQLENRTHDGNGDIEETPLLLSESPPDPDSTTTTGLMKATSFQDLRRESSRLDVDYFVRKLGMGDGDVKKGESKDYGGDNGKGGMQSESSGTTTPR